MTERLEALERRISALEERLDNAPAAASGGPLWILDGLRPRTAGTTGAVMFAGVWQPENSDGSSDTLPVEWQYGRSVDDLIDLDWADAASALAALGHPVRLELLRQVLTGTTATRELSETEGLGTSGQLHHHLRALVAAGWLRQRHRGDYEVPGPRIIPLLAIITATGGS